MAAVSALRSKTMRAVKDRDTAPEMAVRKIAHGMGFRYRLHRSDLPGKPDLVFPRLKKAIFVHGCFWHQHDCPRGARVPKSSQEYWLPKLRRNQERDRENQAKLQESGWELLVIWECEVKDHARLHDRIRVFLTP